MEILIVLLIVFLVVLVGILLWAIATYNRLVALRNRFKNAYAQIDVQLKRRYDLIPNLVETAKAYLKHERETLEAVIAARNQAAQLNQQVADDPTKGSTMKSLMGAESMLGGALGRLFAVAEQYPDLKANQNMAQLKEELSSTENKISFARQAYNDSAMVYNTSRESFPNIVIAGPLNFLPAELFEVENQQEREAPKVQFN